MSVTVTYIIRNIAFWAGMGIFMGIVTFIYNYLLQYYYYYRYVRDLYTVLTLTLVVFMAHVPMGVYVLFFCSVTDFVTRNTQIINLLRVTKPFGGVQQIARNVSKLY